MGRVKEFKESLEGMPIIAAVKNESELALAVQSACQVVFLLYGDICRIAAAVAKVKESGKFAIVHLDLIEGLENKAVAVDFIRMNTQADGTISTKLPLVKASKEAGLITIQRFFVLDSRAFEITKKHVALGNADVVEILPGVMPKVISRLSSAIRVPLIAGGLISDKEDVITALGAGASAVSSTCSEIWNS